MDKQLTVFSKGDFWPHRLPAGLEGEAKNRRWKCHPSSGFGEDMRLAQADMSLDSKRNL